MPSGTKRISEVAQGEGEGEEEERKTEAGGKRDAKRTLRPVEVRSIVRIQLVGERNPPALHLGRGIEAVQAEHGKNVGPVERPWMRNVRVSFSAYQSIS